MDMKTSKVENWVWILIYGGLLVMGLGIAMERQGGELGHLLVVGGIAAAAGGVVLIWVRSRMKDKP
jgi:hypothetical protein